MTRPRPGTRLRVVDWNVERDRGHHTVAHELATLARKADVMLLQETQGYDEALAEVPGFQVISFHDREHPEQDETAILVRRGLEVTDADVVPVTTRGWFTVRGGMTPPKWATVCRVEGVGFASVHTPPTVQTPLGRRHSPLRWAAYRQLMGKLPQLVKQLGPWAVVGGDWNIHARSDHGGNPHLPLATFHRLGLRRVAPGRGTHGRRVIDYLAVAPTLHVDDMHIVAGHFGSDHRPVAATITVKEKP